MRIAPSERNGGHPLEGSVSRGTAQVYRKLIFKAFFLSKQVRIILNPAVERGAEAQLIQPSGLTQKPQLTHRVSLHFCASPSPDLG